MQLSKIPRLVICLTLINRAFVVSAVDDIETLNEEKCSKARKGCCDSMHPIIDEATVECLNLFKGKILPENENDLVQNIDSIACLIKCVYEKRDYLVEGDADINMQAVKENVKKLYADRPKEQQYYIELYEYCRKEAMTLYTLLKNNINKDCKPYYFFVNVCEFNYHMKKTCPYFMWGAFSTPAAQDCKAAKDQCYKING